MLKLDHHCALIVTCVGHENHMKFIVMLVSGLVALFQCIFINSWYLFNLVNKVRVCYNIYIIVPNYNGCNTKMI